MSYLVLLLPSIVDLLEEQILRELERLSRLIEAKRQEMGKVKEEGKIPSLILSLHPFLPQYFYKEAEVDMPVGLLVTISIVIITAFGWLLNSLPASS